MELKVFFVICLGNIVSGAFKTGEISFCTYLHFKICPFCEFLMLKNNSYILNILCIIRGGIKVHCN